MVFMARNSMPGDCVLIVEGKRGWVLFVMVSLAQQHSDWCCNPMLAVFLVSRSTTLRMRSLILILNLIMIVALILTWSSSLLMTCAACMGESRVQAAPPPPLYCLGPGEHPTVACRNVWIPRNISLSTGQRGGGGRKCQGLAPLEYVQSPRTKVQALLKCLPQ